MASNLRLIGVETKGYIDIDEMVADLIRPLLDQDIPSIEINGELIEGLDFIKDSLYDSIDSQLEG
jgi:hypothetical protein